MRSILMSAVFIVAALPAAANPTFVLYDSGGVGVGTDARAGFEEAAALWSSVFTDNVTIRLNVGFKQLASGVLGQTGSTSSDVNYADVRNALGNDRTSAIDASAYASLDPRLEFYSNISSNGTVSAATSLLNAGSSRDNLALSVTTSNQKALGLRADNDTAIDGSITFSSSFKWSFDVTAPWVSGSYDFVGIAAHEIGHALGFVSGVDIEDYYAYHGFSWLDTRAWTTPLDLFRYKNGARDLTVAGTPCFSIDGGATCGARFATGYYKGDHRQASHWKDGLHLGILDPTAAAKETLRIGANDLAAFDAIGWDIALSNPLNPRVLWSDSPTAGTSDSWTVDLDPSVVVPEPGSLTMAVLGLAALGLVRRRQAQPRSV